MRTSQWMGLLVLLLVPLWARAQDSTYMKVRHLEILGDPVPKQKHLRKQFRHANDSLMLGQVCDDISMQKGKDGFAEFAIDAWEKHADSLRVWIHLGPLYILDSLHVDGLNETYAERAGITRLSRKRDPFYWPEIRGRLFLCLDEYQDQGYPFARFDSLRVDFRKAGDTMHTAVSYKMLPGMLVTLDSVLVLGDIREHDEFVRRLAGLFPGDIYDQSQIDQARRLLNGSVYFKNVKEPKVEFLSEDKAKVTLEMESRKSGKFDLLLGILPPRQAGEKVQFTGLVDIQLVSPLFRAGEALQFRFDKLPGTSQKMHLQYSHPYLFGSPIKVQGEFDLLKQDTLFQNRWGKMATSYSFSPNLSIRLYYKGKASSLLSTKAYELDSTRTPPVLDARDRTYGLGFEFENLDYRFNPRKGVRISADVGIGSKKIVRNPRLAESIYDGLKLTLPKREADFQIEWYRAFSKRLVLKLANRTYWLDQSQYFNNDMLQVGGSRSIRGFNENQFYANFLSLFTIETRFILEENSYLFVFSDYAYLEDVTAPVTSLRPWGLGLGMTYETKAGMLSLTYATGQVGQQSFQPARGRIHIGLINQF